MHEPPVGDASTPPEEPLLRRWYVVGPVVAVVCFGAGWLPIPALARGAVVLVVLPLLFMLLNVLSGRPATRWSRKHRPASNDPA